MEQNSPSIEFLYDFMYLDAKRFASYFAQFNEHGALTSIKVGAQLTENWSAHADGGIPAVFKSGGTAGDSSTESFERQFDASLALPAAVIDKLDECNFIHRNIESAPLGQLVLTEGGISVRDVRMMRSLWQPVMNIAIRAEFGSITGKPGAKATKQGPTKRARQELDDMLKVLEGMPHALLMTFTAGSRQLWATLEPDNMPASPEDISLKHGQHIPGKWHVLGVLDARPDHLEDEHHPAVGFPVNEVFEGIDQAVGAIREMLGRPKHAYGITPLAIFRTLKPS